MTVSYGSAITGLCALSNPFQSLIVREFLSSRASCRMIPHVGLSLRVKACYGLAGQCVFAMLPATLRASVDQFAVGSLRVTLRRHPRSCTATPVPAPPPLYLSLSGSEVVPRRRAGVRTS